MKIIYIECDNVSKVNVDNHLKIYDYYKKYDYSHELDETITCDFGKGVKTYQMAKCIFIDKKTFTLTYIIAIIIKDMSHSSGFESVSLVKSHLYQEKADFESMEFLESREYERLEQVQPKNKFMYYFYKCLKLIDEFIDFVGTTCNCKCT